MPRKAGSAQTVRAESATRRKLTKMTEKWHGLPIPPQQGGHGHATCAAVARLARAQWHGRATAVLVQPDV